MAKVFTVLAVLAGAFGGIMLVLAVLAWPDHPDWTMLAGVSIGCCLHFVFLWAVLHLLSRILGRLEQRSGSVSGQVGK